nr:hypothetical protein [Tanacetum cinerariifolium]
SPGSFVSTTRTLYADLLNLAEEAEFTAPVKILEKGPSEPDPKEPSVGINTFHTTNKNHTPDHTPETTSENAYGDPVIQFMIQNFKQINAMYATFSSKRKEVHPTNGDHPIIEP